MNKPLLILILYLIGISDGLSWQRATDLGIEIGILGKGPFNSITDVEGVEVGHVTLKDGSINTGVTAILPHNKNLFNAKVPAAIYVGNGFGKLAGITQVKELGNLETPIILTNTLSVATAVSAVVTYTLNQDGNENVRSVNAVVGETNDGRLNDIRGMHVKESHVIQAINSAKGGPVEEGSVGAGTGTTCFGFKGGIGTSSRVLPESLGGYKLGVLVQTNFGGILEINGAPVGRELGRYYLKNVLEDNPDGSCMIVIATDAPITSRNLERIAKRAVFGIARTGGIASNGSGDYVIAFTTNKNFRIQNNNPPNSSVGELDNDAMTPLFLAAIEATEEAIINSLLMATEIPGSNVPELPTDKLIDILRKYGKVK